MGGLTLFYPKLYVSPNLKKKKRTIVGKIKKGKLIPNLYVITLSQGSNMMEFYHEFILNQPYYKEHMPYIIGISKGYEETVELVQKILLDAYEHTGEYNIKKFILGEENT